MHPTFNVTQHGGSGAVGALAVLMALIGIAVTIFWMVCAWRAMRAHEKLAKNTERLSWAIRSHEKLADAVERLSQKDS